MKKILGLLLFVPLGQIAAADANTILSCVTEDNTRTVISYTQKSIRIQETYIVNDWETDLPRDVVHQTKVKLLGQTNLKYLDEKMTNPVASLVGINPAKDDSHLNISRDPIPGTKKHVIGYSISGGSRRDILCEEGPAYGRFSADLNQAPVMPLDDVEEYWDSELALSCRDEKTGVITRQIRAMHFGFGSSNVQLKDAQSQDSFNNLGDYDRVVRNSTILTYSQSGEGFHFPPLKASVMTVNARVNMLNGKKNHEVSFTDSKGITERYTCEERHAYNNLLAPAKESRKISKELPEKGSLSNLDPKFCPYGKAINQAGDRARVIQGMYSDLIMNIPDVNGMGIGVTEPDEHPLNKRCIKFSIMTSTDEGLENAKKLLGESLKGVLIEYRKVGVISIH